jgi:hypothetical protein
MTEQTEKFGMGWLSDYPDFRYYSCEHKLIKPMLQKAHLYNPELVSGSKATLT